LFDWRNGSPLDDPNYTAEYLLNRYRNLGLRFLDHVFGHFVVIICDDEKSRLILASDHSGIHQVFYLEKNNCLFFGTKIVSLSCVLNNDLVIDRSLENFLLSCAFLPWERTFYKGVKLVPSGSILEWTDGHISFHTIQENDPWKNRFSNIDFESSTEKDVIDALYDAFMLALEEQCPSLNNTSVILGGFDSAIVASGLSQIGKNVETFTFDFGSKEYNQPHTDTLASYLKIKHNWVPITKDIIKNELLKYPSIYNQVSAHPHYLIHTELICKIIKKREINYIFTGDGCDVLFLVALACILVQNFLCL